MTSQEKEFTRVTSKTRSQFWKVTLHSMPPRRLVSFRIAALLSSALLAFVIVLGHSAPACAQATAKRDFTFEEAVGRGIDLGGSPRFFAQWLPDGARFLQMGRSGAVIVDARTGNSRPVPESKEIEAAFATVPGVTKEQASGYASRLSTAVLVSKDRFILVPMGADYGVYDTKLKKAFRATNSPSEAKLNPQVSPSGTSVAYTKADNNLYVSDVATGKETRLTSDGGEKILNGKLDWVYEEELYGRGNTTGYEWSPDGTKIAFLRLDESPVKPFQIIDQVPLGQNTERWYYPKAGDPNPIVTLGIVDIAAGGRTRFVPLDKYPETDRLIVRFGWSPDSRTVHYQVQPRNQRWLDLNSLDLETGKVATLIRENSNAWVEAEAEPVYLKDGTFLWASDRTGTKHLYLYRPDGRLIRAVTSGKLNILRVHGVDEPRKAVLFDAASEGRWTGSDLFRASLTGKSVPIRLTETAGTHSVSVSPKFDLFVDSVSSHTNPGETHLRDAANGRAIRVLQKADPANLAEIDKQYRLGTVRTVQVPTRDGTILDGALLLPPGYDPKKRYPVFCPVYAGPASPTLRDNWGSLRGSVYNQFLAQKGILVWMFDNRSASQRGTAATHTLYRHFGEGELRDIEDGLNYLIKEGYADSTRVAISGWSFGGFMTQYALTHSKMFKVGIAGAGVADWKLYDTIYTERYMDTPQNNPQGYAASSNVEAAANLSGKLLLLHGTMDDNVHVQNTMQLIYALQNAGKQFDLMLYPKNRHGVGGLQARHLRVLQTRYLLDNL